MADKIRKIFRNLKEKITQPGSFFKKTAEGWSAFTARGGELWELFRKTDKKGGGTDKPVDLMEAAELIEKILTLVTYCSIGY